MKDTMDATSANQTKSQTTPVDLDTVIAEYQSPLLRYVVQLLWPDEASSQDVVQTTFMKLHRLIVRHGSKKVKNMRAWLYRVAHNQSMDILRRRKRLLEVQTSLKDDTEAATGLQSRSTDDLEKMEKRELYEFALEQMNQLPDEQKQVLLLKHIQGLTLREISKITGMNIGTVNYRLTQGLTALAKCLKAESAGPREQGPEPTE